MGSKHRHQPPPPPTDQEQPENPAEEITWTRPPEAGDAVDTGSVVDSVLSEQTQAATEATRQAPRPGGVLPGKPVSIDTYSGENLYTAMLVVLGLASAVLLFVMRRSLVAVLPELMILAIFGGLLIFLYRRYLYRDVEDVRGEYAPLVTLLSSQGLSTYQTIIGRAWSNILKARDKSERIRDALRRENLNALEAHLDETKRALRIERDPKAKTSIEKSIRDQEKNIEMLRSLRDYLAKYEESKRQLMESCRNLRLKVEVLALHREVGGAACNDEMDVIVGEIDKLDFIFESVDRNEVPDRTQAP